MIPELDVPVWMLTHPDLRQTARVRAFMQHVGDAVAGSGPARGLACGLACGLAGEPAADPA